MGKLQRDWWAESLAEARAEGKAEIILNQLVLRFGQVAPAIRKRVKSATAKGLDKWTENVIAAQNIDQVFSDGSPT